MGLYAKGAEQFKPLFELTQSAPNFRVSTNDRNRDGPGVESLETIEAVVERLSGNLDDGITVGLNVQQNVDLTLRGDETNYPIFHSISLGIGKSNLHSIQTKSLQVQSAGHVELENCKILRLSVNISNSAMTLRVRNCGIGELKINNTNVAMSTNIELIDSTVLQLSLTNDFDARDLLLTNVTFAKTEEEIELTIIEKGFDLPRLDRTSFAILQTWANKVGDTKVAHIARGYELSIEQTRATGFEKLVLYMWGLFANYGLSISKPLFWIFFLYCSMFVILLWSGTDVGFDPKSGVPLAWKQHLVGETASAQISRALLGATDGIFPSFAVLAGSKLVLPLQWSVAVLKTIYSFISFFLILLAGFSLRRRFKPS